jgi:hypothetical protein
MFNNLPNIDKGLNALLAMAGVGVVSLLMFLALVLIWAIGHVRLVVSL